MTNDISKIIIGSLTAGKRIRNAELLAYAAANDLEILEIRPNNTDDFDALYCGDYPAPCNCDDPTTHDRKALQPKDSYAGEGSTKYIPGAFFSGATVIPMPQLKDIVCGDYPAPCNCDDPETHNGH